MVLNQIRPDIDLGPNCLQRLSLVGGSNVIFIHSIVLPICSNVLPSLQPLNSQRLGWFYFCLEWSDNNRAKHLS